MLKNDFLLRVILFAGFFVIARPFIELIGLFVGLSVQISFWVGIIGAALFSFYFHGIVFGKIQQSIVRQGGITTTMKWALYVFTGITLLAVLTQIINATVYQSPVSLKTVIFTGEFLDRLKAFGILLVIIFGAIHLSKNLVNKIGFQAPSIDLMGSNFTPTSSITSIPVKETLDVTIREKNDKQTLHGSSEFLDKTTFNERYNKMGNAIMRENFEQTGGYVIMPNALKYINHTHMITIAGAGQGKGTTAIIPNLLTKPHESWIVLDVKGENAAVTARFQKESGQKVFIIDPFDVQRFIEAKHNIPSCGFNPLVVAKYLPDEEMSDFAAMMAEMFIPEAGKSSSADGFWVDSARNVLKGYILHLITDKDIESKDRHLGKLYEWLRLDQNNEVELWVNMAVNPQTEFLVNEIRSLAIGSAKTWLGILSEARRATAFLESPLIKKSLQSDESGFDPMMLQRENTTAYVILPERNLNTHKTWLRLVFGTTLKLCNFIAKRRVNFLLDEFPILGKMEDFLRAYSFGRGQKISCWIFAQSLSQLKEIYGEDGLNTFLSNAKLRQFFGMNDLYTQKFVSDLLGTTTEITSVFNQGVQSGFNANSGTSTSNIINVTNSIGSGSNSGKSAGQSEQIVQRPLLTPEEVGKLNNEFVLLVDGDKYRISKTPYFNNGVYPGRFDPNPYVN
ncbi:MAG: type IV secretory system conjugative DNA transfer family protein [Bacteroidetes bacterium]|nr:type IV secretory system conjugative DNA transfer family protein [Bacteroidota bacterium]